MRALTLALLAAALAVTVPSIAHDQRYRSPDLKPRIGLMSDEVALQRLRTAGIANPRVIRRERGRLVVEALVGSDTTTLYVDLLRGSVTNARNPAQIIVPIGRADRPQVTGPQLRVERERLADPSRMRNMVATPR
jgi:hypothetical protein